MPALISHLQKTVKLVGHQTLHSFLIHWMRKVSKFMYWRQRRSNINILIAVLHRYYVSHHHLYQQHSCVYNNASHCKPPSKWPRVIARVKGELTSSILLSNLQIRVDDANLWHRFLFSFWYHSILCWPCIHGGVSRHFSMTRNTEPQKDKSGQTRCLIPEKVFLSMRFDCSYGHYDFIRFMTLP